MDIKIHWIYSGEPGYWYSMEGRFDVYPDGWRGGVSPDGYRVRDAVTGDNSKLFDTVTAAKGHAIDLARKTLSDNLPDQYRR